MIFYRDSDVGISIEEKTTFIDLDHIKEI